MGPEVRHGETTFTRELKLEAVRLIRDRGVSYAQVWQDLNVHPTQLRSWVKAFADDPQRAFPGQGQMKPEQLEIARLKREVLRLKAERDIQKNRGCRPLHAFWRHLSMKSLAAFFLQRHPYPLPRCA